MLNEQFKQQDCKAMQHNQTAFITSKTVEQFIYTTAIAEACNMHQDCNTAFSCIISPLQNIN